MTDRQWHVPSVQQTGRAVITVVTADGDTGNVLVGTADRSLTHLSPVSARELATALQEAAHDVQPDHEPDEAAVLLEALRGFIAAETDR